GNIYPLQIINWCDLCPLYEIFDNPLRKDVESILGIDCYDVKEKVLMTGIVPIEKDIDYYRINFFPDGTNHLKSNNYQIFGNLIKTDGKPVDKVIVDFKSTNVYGFSAIIETFLPSSKYLFIMLQYIDCYINYNLQHQNISSNKFFVNSQIVWILVGIPKEVGF
ncbi:16812_t:CDS:1, partial [Dentiscutata erythropus]